MSVANRVPKIGEYSALAEQCEMIAARASGAVKAEFLNRAATWRRLAGARYLGTKLAKTFAGHSR
jgi:hypothetical protein